jgi:hypothetical protein
MIDHKAKDLCRVEVSSIPSFNHMCFVKKQDFFLLKKLAATLIVSVSVSQAPGKSFSGNVSDSLAFSETL